jgi:hypothetical protein
VNLHRLPQFIRDLEECADYLGEQAGEQVLDLWREALRERLKLLE